MMTLSIKKKTFLKAFFILMERITLINDFCWAIMKWMLCFVIRMRMSIAH